jgi:hypothetical protein
MFYVGERPWELIIYRLCVLKKDIGEVDEEMSQGIEWPSEIIFRFLGIEKIDFDEVA